MIFKNKKETDTILLVGLGNPEKKYDYTRHNIGFMAIDYLSKNFSIDVNVKKHKGLLGSGIVGGRKVILLKPLTYMNLSGESIKKVKEYNNISIENIIIICDDIHLPLGKIRCRLKGSSGGHNGLKNIENHLSTNEYKRIRVGVGEIKEGVSQVDYVLGRFSLGEIKEMDRCIEKIGESVIVLINEGIDRMVQFLNS